MTSSIRSTVSPIQITRDVFLIKKETSWKMTAAKIALWVSCAFGVGLVVAIGTLFADLYRNVSSRSSLDKKTVVELTDLDPPAKLPELLKEQEQAAPATSTIATLPVAEEPAQVAPQAAAVEEKPAEPAVKASTPAPKAGFWTTGKTIAVAIVGTVALAAAGYMAYQNSGANAMMSRGFVPLPDDAQKQSMTLPAQPTHFLSNAPRQMTTASLEATNTSAVYPPLYLPLGQLQSGEAIDTSAAIGFTQPLVNGTDTIDNGTDAYTFLTLHHCRVWE